MLQKKHVFTYKRIFERQKHIFVRKYRKTSIKHTIMTQNTYIISLNAEKSEYLDISALFILILLLLLVF